MYYTVSVHLFTIEFIHRFHRFLLALRESKYQLVFNSPPCFGYQDKKKEFRPEISSFHTNIDI